MFNIFQKVKSVLALTLIASICYGAVHLNSVVYDITVSVDDSKSVDDFLEQEIATYYETLNFTTTTGGIFTFDNYSSDLTNQTEDTQLLIYNDADALLITDRPWAFNDSASIGFGGGQIDNFSGLDRTEEPFYGLIELEPSTPYTAVFASFQPNTLGTMEVRMTAPSQILTNDFYTAIPEPKDTGMIIALIVVGFVAFSYFNIRSKM